MERYGGVKYFSHTVDGNGNAFMESVAISTDEGGNLSELVDLEVVGRNTLCRLSLDNLEVNVVGLRDCANGSGAGVALKITSQSKSSEIQAVKC